MLLQSARCAAGLHWVAQCVSREMRTEMLRLPFLSAHQLELVWLKIAWCKRIDNDQFPHWRLMVNLLWAFRERLKSEPKIGRNWCVRADAAGAALRQVATLCSEQAAFEAWMLRTGIGVFDFFSTQTGSAVHALFQNTIRSIWGGLLSCGR